MHKLAERFGQLQALLMLNLEIYLHIIQGQLHCGGGARSVSELGYFQKPNALEMLTSRSLEPSSTNFPNFLRFTA